MRRLNYANVMATLAFFFALSGSAMAVNKYLLADDRIAAGDLAGSMYGEPVIAPGAVTSAKFDSSATAPHANKVGGLNVVPGTCLAGTCAIRNVVPGEQITGTVGCAPNRIPITVLMSAPDVHVVGARTFERRDWLEITVKNQGPAVESLTWTPLCLGSP